jgi:hypothetical protein
MSYARVFSKIRARCQFSDFIGDLAGVDEPDLSVVSSAPAIDNLICDFRLWSASSPRRRVMARMSYARVFSKIRARCQFSDFIGDIANGLHATLLRLAGVDEPDLSVVSSAPAIDNLICDFRLWGQEEAEVSLCPLATHHISAIS